MANINRWWHFFITNITGSFNSDEYRNISCVWDNKQNWFIQSPWYYKSFNNSGCYPDCFSQQQQRILSLETEIDGYKKAISKEQEGNEKLMMILAKTEQDIATVKKLLAQCIAKHDALKNEYATYTRMLHETEQALNRANAVG